MISKNKYYSLTNILKKDAQYNIIFGQRSNGKTYAVKKYGLEKYIKTGEQMAYIRRQDIDLKKDKCDSLFSDLEKNGVVSDLTHGEYTNIYYYSSRWYLCYYDEKEKGIWIRIRFVLLFLLFQWSITNLHHIQE